jgi:hypothetical protein
VRPDPCFVCCIQFFLPSMSDSPNQMSTLFIFAFLPTQTSRRPHICQAPFASHAFGCGLLFVHQPSERAAARPLSLLDREIQSAIVHALRVDEREEASLVYTSSSRALHALSLALELSLSLPLSGRWHH